MRRWLLTLLTACGSLTEQTAELGAAQSGASAGEVSIIVLSSSGDGSADTAAIVIFRDPGGATIQHGVVDATGHARASLPDGGSVTVLQLDSVFERITTIRGVKPGDQLTSGRVIAGRQVGNATLMSLNFAPSVTPVGPANALTECGGGSRSSEDPNRVTLTFYEGCVQKRFDALALAYDLAANPYFMWLPDLHHHEGHATRARGDWTLFGSSSTNITNVPDNSSLGATISTLIDGVSFEMSRVSADPATETSYVFNLGFPFTPGMRSLVSAGTRHGLTPAIQIVKLTSQSPAQLAMDFAERPLPVLSIHPFLTATGLTWNESGERGAPDARLAIWIARWTDANNVVRTAVWEVMEPPEPATSLTLPGLPAAYADLDPLVAGASLFVMDGGVRYVDYDIIPDYDVARQSGTAFGAIGQMFLDSDFTAVTSSSSHF